MCLTSWEVCILNCDTADPYGGRRTGPGQRREGKENDRFGECPAAPAGRGVNPEKRSRCPRGLNWSVNRDFNTFPR